RQVGQFGIETPAPIGGRVAADRDAVERDRAVGLVEAAAGQRRVVVGEAAAADRQLAVGGEYAAAVAAGVAGDLRAGDSGHGVDQVEAAAQTRLPAVIAADGAAGNRRVAVIDVSARAHLARVGGDGHAIHRQGRG